MASYLSDDKYGRHVRNPRIKLYAYQIGKEGPYAAIDKRGRNVPMTLAVRDLTRRESLDMLCWALDEIKHLQSDQRK
jgi:hypothetical protein